MLKSSVDLAFRGGRITTPPQARGHVISPKLLRHKLETCKQYPWYNAQCRHHRTDGSNLLGRPIGKSSPGASRSRYENVKEKGPDKLFGELGTLMEKGKQSELSANKAKVKTWGQRFKDFFIASKHQLINVGAGFVCLICVSQAVDGRLESKKLRMQLVDANDRIQDLGRRIDYIKSNEFAGNVLDKFESHNESNQRVDRGLLGFLSRPSDNHGKVLVSKELLGSVVNNEIKHVIGGAWLTESERVEKERERLRRIEAYSRGAQDFGTGTKSVTETIEVEEDEQTLEDGGSTQVLRRRRIMF